MKDKQTYCSSSFWNVSVIDSVLASSFLISSVLWLSEASHSWNKFFFSTREKKRTSSSRSKWIINPMESGKKKIEIESPRTCVSSEKYRIIGTRRKLFSGLLSCIILRLCRDKTLYDCRFSLDIGAYYLEEIWIFRVDVRDRTSCERYDNRWNARINV